MSALGVFEDIRNRGNGMVRMPSEGVALHPEVIDHQERIHLVADRPPMEAARKEMITAFQRYARQRSRHVDRVHLMPPSFLDATRKSSRLSRVLPPHDEYSELSLPFGREVIVEVEDQTCEGHPQGRVHGVRLGTGV